MSHAVFVTITLTIVMVVIPIGGIADGTERLVNTSQTPSTETTISRVDAIDTLAKRWRLDKSEYQRYLELINGPLGKWSPAIDPLLALGMFADSPQQERRYAELYAQQEFDFTERTLRFQQAYRDAFDRLYPNVGMLDQRLLAPYFFHQQQKFDAKQAMNLAKKRFVDGDRLLVFVPLSCKQCLSTITRLMGLLSGVKNGGVDIYVRDAEDDAVVRQWGQAHQLQKSWLENQNLTLNRDEGLFQQLANRSSISTTTTIPVFLNRNERFFQLSLGDLGL